MDTFHDGVPVSIEVSMSEVMRGVFEIKGVLRFADEAVVVEYREHGARSQPSGAETFHLPLAALQEVVLKGGKIILRPRRLSTLGQVPWTTRETVVFQVKRAHRTQAAALVAQLQEALAERGVEASVGIPFRLPDANLGFTEIKGIVYVEEEYLVFEVATGVSGGSQKKRQTIKIEARALEALHLDPGTFSDHLYVRPKERDLFRVMPGMYRGKDELKMKISTSYRGETEHLVDAVRQLQ